MSQQTCPLPKKVVQRLISTGHVYSSGLTASGELHVCIYENGAPFILDRASFDLIDHRLYPILAELYAVAAKLDVANIRLLVRFLETPPYVLPAWPHVSMTEDAYMSSISYFVVHEESLRFEANGGQYKVARTPSGALYPTGFMIGEIIVPFKRMDAMYPGWLLRYKVAEGLGLEKKNILEHMFSATSSVMARTGSDLPLDL